MISPVTKPITKPNKTIQFVEAICGAGKTQGLIKLVNNSPDMYMIAVSSKHNGKKLAERIKGAEFIYSGKDDKSGYVDTLVENARLTVRVIIVMHQGLAVLYRVAYKLQDRHLIIDELTGNVYESGSIKLSDKHSGLVDQYFEYGDEFTLGSAGKCVSLEYKYKGEVSCSEGLSGKFNRAVIAASRGFPVVGKVGNNGIVSAVHYSAVDEDYLSRLEAFKSVTLLSATVLKTLNHCILTSLDYKFTPASWSINKEHKPFEGKVYIIEERKISRTRLNKSTIYHQSIEEVVRREAANLLNHDNSVWFANSDWVKDALEQLNIFDANYTVLTPEQKGSNEYLRLDNAACLFSINASPIHKYMIHKLGEKLGLAKGELLRSWSVSNYLEPVYQNCLRTSFRVQDITSTNIFVIPDMRAYEYLKGKIPDLPKPIVLFPEGFDEEPDKRTDNQGRPSSCEGAEKEIMTLWLSGKGYEHISNVINNVSHYSIGRMVRKFKDKTGHTKSFLRAKFKEGGFSAAIPDRSILFS